MTMISYHDYFIIRHNLYFRHIVCDFYSVCSEQLSLYYRLGLKDLISTVRYIHLNIHMDRGLFVNTSLILNRKRCTEIRYKCTFHVYISLL